MHVHTFVDSAPFYFVYHELYIERGKLQKIAQITCVQYYFEKNHASRG